MNKPVKVHFRDPPRTSERVATVNQLIRSGDG